jgi:hypothetical protein
MTNNPSLIAREESFTGDANAREQEVERAGTALTNPGCRPLVCYCSDNRIASRSGSVPNQR